jgi:hypothetical protein
VTKNECVICGRPTPDGNACVTDAVDRPRQLLGEIQDMLAAAIDVAHRQARHGTGGGASGKPGSALPLDLGATARLDGVQTALTTWARHIAEERGATGPRAEHYGHPINAAVSWLYGHLEWMRHRAEVDEWLRDVEACARIVRGIARGPADRVYLGPCGALVLTPEPWEPGTPASTECDGSVYGRLGAAKAKCKTCETEYDQDQRIRERQDLAHSYTYTAAEIEHAYGGVILASTIRQWRKRGLLTVHGEADGKRLYAIGEVLQVAATAKERQRRETAEMGA